MLRKLKSHSHFSIVFFLMNPSPSTQNPISQPLKKANPSSQFTPSRPSDIDWSKGQLGLQFRLITFPCLAKLQPQNAVNAFHGLHHHSKIYLLTGYIMIIEPRAFNIQHRARMLSLTGMLNSAAMAQTYLFLLNEL